MCALTAFVLFCLFASSSTMFYLLHPLFAVEFDRKRVYSSNFQSALCSFCSWLPWDFEIRHFLIRPQFLLLPEVIHCYSGHNMIDQFPTTVHSLPPPLIHGVQFLSVNIGGLRLHAGADTTESHQFPRFRSDRSTFCNSILVQLTTPSPYRIIDTAQGDWDNLLASLQTFCLTDCAHLNMQNYGLFCSLAKKVFAINFSLICNILPLRSSLTLLLSRGQFLLFLVMILLEDD